ncbi:hypothetical protein NVP1139A_19 [Vibrio phage 1.139.A._10N.261.48.C6]|nr:hypothetical protein NVP1034O_19 [Vibrio phage 1.034.O._10N.261.46.B7]AUR83449.1 hypothetical protein NVP1034X_19 [Vibrio phage 1.034.X._10N.261.46.B7]AUR90187.1 hypothetical protein NVP1139A_19 [Vibrio phage 1.139.A._10N.261.48.C6]AUR90254.1 hypothetical protein NVP1139B_19 [Vibrio phage 1.139.B._10N.261.48.C6]AUR95576.1 hypothetical protein NVP1209O_19 [Vibrio phage 1.209.O._10N.222.52.B2]
MTEHPQMSCLLSAKLDWHDTGAYGKWTRQQQVIKLSTRLWQQTGMDISLYPAAVLTTKVRVPGAGNVLQLRYEGEPGKPFKFIGVDMTFRANREK